MEILTLKPALKQIIWGGRKLIDDFGMKTELENVAEAWLLSCHKSGESTVLGGQYNGMVLSAAIEKMGRECLGTHCSGRDGFPILIKIIDACDRLSVQVHPGDEYARRVENENGKTEAWYILEADEGAQLVYGVNRDMSRGEFQKGIDNGTLEDLLNFVPVKKGDVAFIPSGTLHAIGKGILLAEVQQSCDTTYRVYDYDRVGKDGKKRELHVQKALDVVSLKKSEADFSPIGTPVHGEGFINTLLTKCDYFSMTSLNVDGEAEFTADETSFVSLLVLSGEARLVSENGETALNKGVSVFIPANYGNYTIGGKADILETRV